MPNFATFAVCSARYIFGLIPGARGECLIIQLLWAIGRLLFTLF